MRRRPWSIAAGGLVVALLAGCGSSASSAPSTAPASATATASAAPSAAKQVTIGALYLDQNGFYGGIKKGIETGAADLKLQLLGNNSGGDASKEAAFMSTLIGAKVDAIIMSPVSATASVPLVKQAFDAGIPVVCYNTCINDADAQKYVKALVTTDQTQMGTDVGDAAADWFVAKGMTAPNIGILNCDVYEACVQRKTGFKAALLMKVPGAKFVSDQEGFVLDKATQKATDMLTANPEIDAFYATTDNGAMGGIQGILATGHEGKTVVFGSDMSTPMANYLLTKPDILILTNGQTPQQMGALAVQQALKAINGEKIDNYLTITPTHMYFASTPDDVKTWQQVHADGLP